MEPTRKTLIFALTALAALAPAAAASADTWSAPLTVPRSTVTMGPTQLLFHAGGSPAVIARGNIGFRSQILQSEQFQGGEFLQFGRAFSGTQTQGANDFAYDARGDGVMAGLSGKPHGPSFVALRATRKPGSTFGPRQEVSPGETQATTLQIAISDRGDALVTWVMRFQGHHRIAYVLRRAGRRFGPRHLLSFSVPTSRHLGFRLQPTPAVDEEGNVALLFGDDRDHRRIATGTLSRGLTATQDLGPGNSDAMSLDLRHGSGVAVWLNDRSPAAPQLFASTVHRGTHRFSGAVDIAGTDIVNTTVGPPRAVALADGRVVVAAAVDPNATMQSSSIGVWVSPLAAGQLQRRSAGQGEVADEPSLVAGPDGGATLAFGARQTPGGPASVYATTLSASRQAFSPVDLVASLSQLRGGVVAGAGPAGRAGVVWNDGAVRVSLHTAG